MGVLPPVIIELKANATEFKAEMGKAKDEVTELSRKNAGDFDKVAAVGKAAFLGLAGAAVAFGGTAVKAAMDQQEADARLTASLRDVGSAMTAHSRDVETLSAKMRQLGFDDGDAVDAMGKLTLATRDPAKAIADVSVAADVARGRHIDLAAATDILVKVETGHVAMLGKLGINVKDANGNLIDQHEAVKRLSEMYGGQASAYTKTFAGRMATLKSESEDLAEKVGFMLIPKIEGLMHATSATVEWFEKHKVAAEALGVVIGGPLVAAMTVYIAKQTIALGMKVVDFFSGIVSSVRTAIGTIQTLATTQQFATTSTALWVGGLGIAAAALGYLTLQVQQNAAKQREWAHNFTVAAGDSAQAIDADKKKIAELQAQLDSHGAVAHIPFLRMTVAAQKTEDRIAGLKSEVSRLESAHEGLTNKAQGAAGALGEEGDNAEAAKPKLNDFDAAMAKLRDTEASAKDKADAFKTALDLLIGSNIDAEKAAITYKDKVQALGESLKDNGKSLDINTDSGRKNRTAIEDTIEAARNHIESMKKQGASLGDMKTAFDDQVTSIKNTLTYYGYSKTQIEELLTQYGMVPSSINTVLQIDDSPALRSLAETKKQIDEVNAAAKNGFLPAFATAGPGGVVKHAATGNRVRAGEPVVVGEYQRELFIPDQSGRIEPSAPSSRGGGDVNIENLSVSGVQNVDDLLRQLRELMRRNGGRIPVTVQGTAA